VRRVPAQQRQRAKIAAAAHHVRHLLSEERRAPRDVDRHGGRPVRLLIPRQQIAGEREAEDEEQQDDAGHPRHLAWLLVRTEHHDAQHVNHCGNDDEARAEEVQAADDAAERQLIGDVADAVVGVLRRGHVVHRQHHAGNQLHAEQEEQDAAGDEPPAGSGREPFVEQV